jgi:hypothetical protein
MTVKMSLVAKTRGAAYIIYEGEEIYDWRVKTWRSNRSRERLIEFLLHLIHLGDISEVRLPFRELKEGSESKEFLDELLPHLLGRGISVLTMKRSSKLNREDTAHNLANRYPMLRGYLPKRKKLWESESSNMLLFDAAELIG